METAQKLLLTVLLGSTVLAAPHSDTLEKRQQGGFPCSALAPEGSEGIAAIASYRDPDCLERFDRRCLFVETRYIEEGPGYSLCGASDLPPESPTPFYVRIEEATYPDTQILYTRDQVCATTVPGGVIASLNADACVQVNLAPAEVGRRVYPRGGSPLPREAPEEAIRAALAKRDSRCNGFAIDSQDRTYSETVQVSPIVDCINSGESDCEIGIERQTTESVSTSYSLTAGGGIEGIFSVEATFGQEFTTEESTTSQQGFFVAAGQAGYLSAFSSATRFQGRFTGCESGDAEQPGTVIAIERNTFRYAVVLTGSFAA